MPRFEYVDHQGNAHVVSATDIGAAQHFAWERELNRTYSVTLADRAAGTVELSDERGRAA